MRHLLAYLLVVGGPLLGLLGVLRLGQDIRAPMAVHGAYVIRVAEADSVTPSSCLRYLFSGTDSTLQITQSGAQLVATLGPEKNVALRGALIGDSITLAGSIDAASLPDSAACAPGDSLRLLGLASRDLDLKRFDGTATTGCATCVAVRVTAHRPRGYAGRRRS